MKILIVDNEPELRSSLRILIEKSTETNLHIDEAEGVSTGVEMVNNFQPDIVFLDIEMNDGSGFDLLQKIGSPSFQLIFTTAHDQYAIQAFKFSAIDYLLKPIDKEELKKCLQKAINNINKKDLASQLSVMMQQLFVKPGDDRKIVLNDKQSTYFIKVKDILFCEAEGPYTRFYIAGSDNIFVSRNLKEFEEMLAPLGFLRTHHSYVVNPAKIKMYDKTDGGALILETGHSVPLSQRRKELVLQSLERDNSKLGKK